MAQRLPLICHYWPGITPWNVWDLRWSDWLMFAHVCDAWTERRREGNG